MKVTVKEAADHFGISQQAVRKRINAGSLRSKREGGRVYVFLPREEEQPPAETMEKQEEKNGVADPRIAFLEERLEKAEAKLEEKEALIIRLLEEKAALALDQSKLLQGMHLEARKLVELALPGYERLVERLGLPEEKKPDGKKKKKK